MEYKVSVKYGNLGAEYTVSASGYYDARVKGLTLFLEENRLPGAPWEYLSVKRGVIEVSANASVDGRKTPEQPVSVPYYLEQVTKLKGIVRKNGLDEDTKREVVGLLIKLEEVLGRKS